VSAIGDTICRPLSMAVTVHKWAEKNYQSSSVLSGDYTIPITANDRQPIISYSCLTVTIVLSLWGDLRHIFLKVKAFWPLQVVVWPRWPVHVHGIHWRHEVSYNPNHRRHANLLTGINLKHTVIWWSEQHSILHSLRIGQLTTRQHSLM